MATWIGRGAAQAFRIERVVWHEKYRGYTRQVVYGLTVSHPSGFPPEIIGIGPPVLEDWNRAALPH